MNLNVMMNFGQMHINCSLKNAIMCITSSPSFHRIFPEENRNLSLVSERQLIAESRERGQILDTENLITLSVGVRDSNGLGTLLFSLSLSQIRYYCLDLTLTIIWIIHLLC